MTPDDLKQRFIIRAGLGDQPSLWEIVEVIREIPYRRNEDKSPEGVVQEWAGTCSTKHALLAALLEDRPEFELRLVHRVYRIDRERARELFGDDAARRVPDGGLVDVHTYATVVIEGKRVQVDVTFPGPLWDARSDMPLSCGDGDDDPVPDGADAREMKALLVAEHCDPSVREPFIAALSATG